MRHVHMLIGITQGMTSAEDFKIYFNWLKPNCFGFLQKIMGTFSH